MKVSSMDVNVYGRGADQIVLVHGLLGLFTTWTHTIPALARHATVFEIVLPDYKDRPGGYSLDDYAGHVLQVLDARHLKGVTLVGNSLGGHIATRIAARHPDRVARLVLITSSGLFDEVAAHEKLIVRTPSRTNVDRVLRHIFHDQRYCDAATVEAVIDYYHAPGGRVRLRSFIRTARNLRTEDAAGDVKRIRIPTLILWGANDRVVPIQIACQFHALIQGSVLEVLDDCGHAPQIEKADEVNRLILEFISSPTAWRGNDAIDRVSI